MCKKTWFLALMISICTLSACGQSYLHDRDMDIYEKIHRYYSEMESYCAKLKITAYSNKTENTFFAEQKVMGNQSFYIKIADDQQKLAVTTIETGGKVKTATEGSDFSVTVPSHEGTGLLFVNRFFAKYYASEDTVLFVNSTDSGRVTVLETALAESNPRFSRAKLTIDNKTLSPVLLEISDGDGQPVLKGAFSDFSYNANIDPSIFSTNE